jgi:phosphoribosylanthranilate isomerase
VTRIKISGVVQPGDAQLAARLGADMVACVFNAQSPRYVTMSQAWAIRRALPPHVALVGVFVDTPPPVVHQVVVGCHLDYVQLFGSEPRSDLDALGPTAFKAVTVEDSAAVDAAVRTYISRWPRRTDTPALLVHLSGALGSAWDLLAGPASRAPLVMAASALDATTAQAAIGLVRPWAVDVWDAVEAEPGKLDPVLLERFMRAVRDADGALDSVEKETRA